MVGPKRNVYAFHIFVFNHFRNGTELISDARKIIVVYIYIGVFFFSSELCHRHTIGARRAKIGVGGFLLHFYLLLPFPSSSSSSSLPFSFLKNIKKWLRGFEGKILKRPVLGDDGSGGNREGGGYIPLGKGFTSRGLVFTCGMTQIVP